MLLHVVSSEKRQFSRINFDAPVKLHNKNKHWKSNLLDVSLKGALIRLPDDWEYGTENEYKLSILPENSHVKINMDVTLVHADENHLGFRCDYIDLDSVTFLKRLVELNIGNEKLLAREISHMLIS